MLLLEALNLCVIRQASKKPQRSPGSYSFCLRQKFLRLALIMCMCWYILTFIFHSDLFAPGERHIKCDSSSDNMWTAANFKARDTFFFNVHLFLKVEEKPNYGICIPMLSNLYKNDVYTYLFLFCFSLVT